MAMFIPDSRVCLITSNKISCGGLKNANFTERVEMTVTC